MAQFHDPDALWRPFGAFSMMALVGDGQIVRLKGQVALDASGAVVGAGDMAAQVRQALANIETALAAVGGRLEDVVELIHYTTDIAAFMACGAIRKEAFRPPYPITTTVEVAALYRPELVVEIAAVAEVPMDRFRRPPAGM